MKLELRGITKRFGALVANDHIDLTVEPGEIHCLLGENGAGKSTLMNVLYGLYQADEGEILLDDDVQCTSPGPGDAMAAGIGMVHQHFMLIPVFTVAENVMLGHEQTGFGGRAQRRRRPRPGARDLGAVRLRRRPGRAGRGPAGRRPAAGRDHQGAVPRREGARLRRADRRAHPAGDRRADGDHAAAQGGRHGDRLHHPQAARGARGRRPDHRHPPRQGRRRGVPDRDERRTGLAHGRPSGRPHRRQGRRRSRASPRSSSRTCRVIDHLGQFVVDDVELRGARRRDPRRRRGAGQRPDRTHRGASWACSSASPATSCSTARICRACPCGRSSTPASASSPRTGRKTASSASSRSPRTSCSTAPPARRSCAFGNLQLGYLAEFAEDKITEFDIRAQGIGTHAGRLSGGNQQKVVHRPRAQPRAAAVRRRPTDPRLGRRIGRIRAHQDRRRRGTPASRSSSSPPNWTR